jgi:hypothetical protein
MTTTAAFDQIWGATQAGEVSEDNPPPVGWVGILVVTDGKMAVSKKNETYMAVDFRDEQGGYSWSKIIMLTKNSVPQEGSIKAAKIFLRQLGIDQNLAGAQVHLALQQAIGTYYAAEMQASDRVNANTGQFFVNTVINSKSAPPAGTAQAAPAQPVSTDLPWDQPAQQAAPVSDVPTTMPPAPQQAPPAAAPAFAPPPQQPAPTPGQTEVFAPAAAPQQGQAAAPTAQSIDPATGKPFGF